MKYGDLKELDRHLLYKQIVEWNENKLVLDNGTIVTLEESDQDCCASASGKFSNVKLNAIITNVEVGEKVNIPDDDTIVNEVKVTLYHNQNPIALAEMTADAGNGGGLLLYRFVCGEWYTFPDCRRLSLMSQFVEVVLDF